MESIREHGVLNPVIVWQKGDGYEMLAGHNRQMAGKLAGLAEIPAIVKTDLTEEEVYVYVIETNVIQRGFAELLPSEKAAVLAERYEKVSSQGRRNDILEEIARLNGQDTAGTCGHDRAVDKPPNFVNVTRYHDKNPAKIAEIFQRKRSWFSMPWPLSSF